jgi:hypothetical protein
MQSFIISISLSVANGNDLFSGKAKKYKKDKDTANNQVENIEDHYRFNYMYFLLFIDHITSKFPISPRIESHFLRLCGMEMLYVQRNDTVWQVIIQKLFSKDGIQMAVGKSILHSPTKYCHLKLFIKILFKKSISCVMFILP